MNLFDPNTLTVLAGATALGLSCGLVGTFLLLRRRALMADALAHATLPGVAGAFLIATLLGHSGRSLPVLLLGAIITGFIGVITIELITRNSRIKPDAAIAIVLGVFFGIGTVLLSFVQNSPAGARAGLDHFIFGKTALMLREDAILTGIIAVLVTLVCTLFFKELRLLAFDESFARGIGRRTKLLDALLLGLVAAVVVIGLQSVGLVLIVAMLVIPPAAARFWTRRLLPMACLSAFLGAASACIGVFASASNVAIASTPIKLPSGPTIVLTATILFLIGVVFGTEQGLVARMLLRRRQARLALASSHASTVGGGA